VMHCEWIVSNLWHKMNLAGCEIGKSDDHEVDFRRLEQGESSRTKLKRRSRFPEQELNRERFHLHDFNPLWFHPIFASLMVWPFATWIYRIIWWNQGLRNLVTIDRSVYSRSQIDPIYD
jgi:hypothetical protein